MVSISLRYILFFSFGTQPEIGIHCSFCLSVRERRKQKRMSENWQVWNESRDWALEFILYSQAWRVKLSDAPLRITIGVTSSLPRSAVCVYLLVACCEGIVCRREHGGGRATAQHMEYFQHHQDKFLSFPLFMCLEYSRAKIDYLHSCSCALSLSLSLPLSSTLFHSSPPSSSSPLTIALSVDCGSACLLAS